MNTVEISLGRGTLAGPSRRGFLEGIGATAFLLAFQVPISSGRAAQPSGAPGQFNAFLAIGEDDIVTAIIAQTEGGQGNSTGMTQVIAAELGAAWPKMRYRFTTERRPEYINPMLYEGLVLTAGSSSILRSKSIAAASLARPATASLPNLVASWMPSPIPSRFKPACTNAGSLG